MSSYHRPPLALVRTGGAGPGQVGKNEMARRDLEVIVIGAGMGGLAAAQKLEQYGFTPKILEKAAEVGGTWRDNKYPGLYVDVPVGQYQMLFAPKWDWSHAYAPGDEIQSVPGSHRRRARPAQVHHLRGRGHVGGVGRRALGRDDEHGRNPHRRRRRRGHGFPAPQADAAHRRHGDLRGAAVPLLGVARRPRRARQADRGRRQRLERHPDGVRALRDGLPGHAVRAHAAVDRDDQEPEGRCAGDGASVACSRRSAGG